MDKEKRRLCISDFQEALDVQDACNLSGVVFHFAQVMQIICNEAHALGMGTNWKNTHPIAVLYSSKIASLTGSEVSTGFSEAFDKCTLEASKGA